MSSSSSGGTGSSLAKTVVIIAGVSSLVASLLSLLSIWLQTKNYRKPLLQRYVVRILLMVPIYAAASWTSIVSLKASLWLDPIRDVYEAFTIYTFFQLLINFLGGERALIIMTHGRPPIQHAWPLNHCLPKVDISDPHTFLAVKRGILQYTWLKPVLAIISIVMKATDSYQEGYLGLTSGYLWTGIVYNVSVTISLYSLAMFWVCLHNDLAPFRPVPKFLCVKLIIFASYWQGFFLSILQWLGALSNGVAGYTPDNLAAAIQDSLICFEMPIFAVTHWYAFSWHDYADPSISSARLPVIYALRDAFGIKDLIEDTKMTLRGENYEYRLFDSGDHIMAHAESESRVRRTMHGMRYERGGKGKYWIPKPGEINSRTPLLSGTESSRRGSLVDRFRSHCEVEESTLDEGDEQLFLKARALEFGDWNYPVITANQAPQDQRLAVPFSYQNAHQPEVVKKPRKHGKIRASNNGGSHSNGDSTSSKSRRECTGDRAALPRNRSSSASRSSHRSQLVDLVIEDREAEEKEQAERHRTTGSALLEPEHRYFQTPSGHPVSGQSGITQMEGPSSPSEHPTRPTEQDESSNNNDPKTQVWSYEGLEGENVWDQ
ncbi:organic solute transporter Ostalpha-domain-containing protein [Aspergillus coremiiformis]|uniref:Organic solute transporter Ostalpha-domain-containing protein n=1 Tax=Aspergillus coremiiformis TaxID=138285 RepID=A0A5N6ZEG6_9EURO|nr:organic solute transporter Ostalpha-domain-containing protein [Aspergillus coremiiformis]